MTANDRRPALDGLRSKDWLIKDLENLSPEARELFEKYSNIPHAEVVSHITRVRNEAFEIFPYPCLGQWGFLDLSIRESPCYPEILHRIKNGDNFLDIGCCVGQDIRKLVFDGAPSENTYASDLESDFLKIGYDLFLDKSTLHTTFIGADIFDNESGLRQLQGNMNIIHAASFFHLFNWNDQVMVAKRVVELLKPESGSLLVGRQVGSVNSGEHTNPTYPSKARFRHNEDSFKDMWKQVGKETATEWEVDVTMDKFAIRGRTFQPGREEARWLRFVVRRV